MRAGPIFAQLGCPEKLGGVAKISQRKRGGRGGVEGPATNKVGECLFRPWLARLSTPHRGPERSPASYGGVEQTMKRAWFGNKPTDLGFSRGKGYSKSPHYPALA